MAEEILNCLASLPSESLSELYSDVCCCIAVLRCLPPLARQVLMRLAFLEQVGVIFAWRLWHLDSMEKMCVGDLGSCDDDSHHYLR